MERPTWLSVHDYSLLIEPAPDVIRDIISGNVGHMLAVSADLQVLDDPMFSRLLPAVDHHALRDVLSVLIRDRRSKICQVFPILAECHVTDVIKNGSCSPLIDHLVCLVVAVG